MDPTNIQKDAPPGDASSGTAGPLRRLLDWRIAVIILIAAISIPIWRATTGHAKPSMIELAPLPVAVAKVARGDLTQELICYAELRPYLEIDLHSKVAGFLEKINVDIGDRVEVGQLLASIEVPELQDDINRAAALRRHNEQEVARAQAAYDDAHQIYTRLMGVDKAQPNLIAQQDLDAALTKDQTTASTLAGAKADVEIAAAEMSKLRTMQKYSQITAPFAGIITKRYADPGALIQSGTSSSTQTLPLVRLSQNDRLRLDVPLSVSYVSRVKVGDPVAVRIESCGQALTGTIARSTRKVETATRTMEVEVDVPNEDLKLIPGMYASVALRLDRHEHTLSVPVEAVARRSSASVFVVGKDNRVEERTVTLGLETPSKLEVLSGLSENDLVMISSRTQVKPGQKVEPRLATNPSVAE